jgi:hypothetical protein
MAMKVFISEIICKSSIVWCIGRADFVNALHCGGGPGFKSHGLHLNLYLALFCLII